MATVSSLTKAAAEQAYSSASVTSGVLTLTRINGSTTIVNVGSGTGSGTSQWLSGTTDPSPFVGNPGDWYINTTTGKILTKGASTWTTQIATIFGQTGTQGIQGLQGPQGPQGPQGIQGPAGGGSSADPILFYTLSSETASASASDTVPVLRIRAPFAFTITNIRASCSVSDGATSTVIDVHGNSDTTILSSKLIVEANEKSSTTSTFPVTVNLPNIADDSEISFYLDSIGSATRGVKIAIYGTLGSTSIAPGQVTNLSRTVGNNQVSLTWTAPSNGGSPITNYIVQYSVDQSSWTTFGVSQSTATSRVVTGLTNGILYYFRVAASNSVGTGVYSSNVSGIPATTANAPTGVAGIAQNAQVALSWNEPANNGSQIFDYVVQFSNDGGSSWATFADGTSSATATTVTGLTNSTAYVFRVAATNGIGTGSYSSNSASVTPTAAATIPFTPSAPSVTSGNAQVSLTWTAPSNGGSVITDYLVQFSSNGGTTWSTFSDGTSTSTSTTVTGLTNGAAYVFRIAAVNAIGTGLYSATSSTVIPQTSPSTPNAPSGSVGDAQVPLSWTAPSNGGSAITDYLVQFSSNGGSSWTTFSDGTSTATSTTVTGLTNGTAYVFRVAAVNAIGTGSYSSASSSVTPVSSSTAPGTPNAPSGSVGNAQVPLSWTAPSNGGSAITDYLVQFSSNGGSSWTTFSDGTSTATSTTVTGLTNGTAYVFRVAAVNAIGTGSYSSASSSITPTSGNTVPLQPTAPVVSSGNAQTPLTWTAPSNGGSAITDYLVQFSSNGGSTWTTFSDGTSTATSTTVTGLTNGTAYVFRVAAVNAIGTGLYSSASNSITPATVPSAPTNLTRIEGLGNISVSWTAPANNGAPITDYIEQYSTDQSTWTTVGGSSTSTSINISGLTPNVLYYFRVAAVNAAGTGSYSASITGRPFGVPLAPSTPTVVAQTSQATVTWTAPSNSGSAITDYLVQFSSNSGSTWTTFSDGTSTATSTTVTGLTNGTAYVFRVAAVNSAGAGSYSSASNSVTPVNTTPSAPDSTSVIGSNASVLLSWTAPSNGGSAITDYVVQFSSNGGSTWTTFSDGTSTATSTTVTGLTNGTAYVFRVAAVNAIGTGSYSSASSSVTPNTNPTYSRTPTANRGGIELGASLYSDARTGSGVDTLIFPRTATGTMVLSVGQTQGNYNDNETYFVSYGLLEFNTSGLLEPGLLSATLQLDVYQDFSITDFTLEVYSYDYGASITTADVINLSTLNPANILASLSTASLGTGLKTFTSNGPALRNAINTNGVTRLLVVSSRSRLGNVPAFGLDNPTEAIVYYPHTSVLTLQTANYPLTPNAPTVVGGSTVVNLTWTAPSNGGSAITDYLVQFSSNGGTTWTTFSDGTSTDTSTSVTGLTNNTAYVFRVAAVNAIGAGSYSSASNSVTPNAASSQNISPTANRGGVETGAFAYSDARTASGVDTLIFPRTATGTMILSVGQTQGTYNEQDTYFVSYGLLEFNTSGLGTLSSAQLKLDVYQDFSITDFTLEVYSYDYGTSITTADAVNLSTLNSSNILASLSTASLGTGLKTFTSNGPALRNAINTNGVTRLLVVSSRSRLGNVPAFGPEDPTEMITYYSHTSVLTVITE
jgi:titin